jgi:hypothetical protein
MQPCCEPLGIGTERCLQAASPPSWQLGFRIPKPAADASSPSTECSKSDINRSEKTYRWAIIRLMQLIAILLFITVSSTASAEEERILDFDALHSETGFRRSVEEKFPDLDFGFYHWTGNYTIGALEDFDHDRILIVVPTEGTGEV